METTLIKNRWKIVFGVLSVLALITSFQLSFKMKVDSTAGFLMLYGIQLIIWYIWGALTFFIYRLSPRLFAFRGVIPVLLHTLSGVFFVVVFLMLYAIIYHLVTQFSINGASGTFKALFTSSFHWYLILYWITVGLEYYLRMQHQLKDQELLNVKLDGELHAANLKALKMQLNPHFLFNSLNTVSSMVRASDAQKANMMLARLSEFLREVLADKNKQVIPIAEELAYVKKYLEVEKLRFLDRLELQFSVQKQAEHLMVPSLLLQPLVENAMKHGIAKKADARHLTIAIVAAEDRCHLEIFNEGPPLDDSKLTMLTNSVGLSNVLNRLSHFYPDAHDFSIKNVTGGVKVHIAIPFTPIQVTDGK